MNRRFWWGNLKERCDLDDLGVDGKIILKWVLNNGDGVDRINLAQDRAVLNVRVS